MNFEYTEQQNMFRQIGKTFATQVVAPLAEEIDKLDKFPKELVKEMASHGLFKILVPKEFGGSGADRISYCVVLEELSRVSTVVNDILVLQTSLCGVCIPEWGNDNQKRAYIPRLINGEIIAAIAVTEPDHGSDGAVETSADTNGDCWIINGTKTYIENGNVADLMLIVCQTDRSKGHKGTVSLLVERGMAGFHSSSIQNSLGKRGSALAELIYNNVRVPMSNQIGKVGEGLKILISGINNGRLGVSASSVGLSQACIDAAIEYAKQRIQFSKPIGSFQLIQAMIADMIVEVEAARLLTYKAATIMDSGRCDAHEISSAKLFSTETAQKVTYKTMQIFGASGYVSKCPIERYYRDARALTIVDGTSEVHRLLIGRQSIGINAFI